jgi:hypothetical protein
MSHDDRASDFEVSRFEENKKELYAILNDKELRYKPNHPRDKEKQLFFSLLDKILGGLEMNVAYKSYGNNEIYVDDVSLFPYDLKKVFEILKKIKINILWFFDIDLSSCRFFCNEKRRSADLTLWFECVGGSKVFNYFSPGSQEEDEDERCGYKIDEFNEYEVIAGGLSTTVKIDDNNAIGRSQSISNMIKSYKKPVIRLTDKLIDKFKLKNNDKLKLKNKKNIYMKEFQMYLQNRVPYRLPKNYMDWAEMIDILTTAFIQKYVFGNNNPFANNLNVYIYNFVQSSNCWLEGGYPVFVVKKEIIDLALNISIDYEDEKKLNKLLEKIDIIYPNILFLFPDNYLEYQEVSVDCDGLTKLGLTNENKVFGFIDHCFVEFKDILKIEEAKEDNCIYGGVMLDCISKNNIPISNAILLPTSSDTDIARKVIVENNKNSLTLNLPRVILNCLLLISSKPDLDITTKNYTDFQPGYNYGKKGFGVVKNEKIYYPRVLSLDYVERTIRSDDKSGKPDGHSQSHKRPHWRLGYEVNKPVGKMKGVPREQWERKLIKVAPYFVLGGDDKDNQTTTEA